MRFGSLYERAQIRGYPHENGEPARLWLNDRELLPSLIENNFNHYYSGFTWGYNEYGSTTTALAVSYALFGDKHIAQALSGLIEKQYVHSWPFEKAFRCEFDLVDFWTANEDSIRKAEQIADRWRDCERALSELRLLLPQNQPPTVGQSFRMEDVPMTMVYGPSADVYWVDFPLPTSLTKKGRCRVDVYPSSQLLIISDIGEGSVQWDVEVIIQRVSHMLKLNPATQTVLQRYQWNKDIDRVTVTYQPKGRQILDPKWQSITQRDFEKIIAKAEQTERRIVWTNNLIPHVIRGVVDQDHCTILVNSTELRYAFGEQGNPSYHWGTVQSQSLKTALAICWRFVKHAPSALQLAPRFLEEQVCHWPQDDNFTIQLTPIRFLVNWIELLEETDFPELRQLKAYAIKRGFF